MSKIEMILAAIGLAALVGLGWVLHHAGYKSGQDERTAYYAPLIEASTKALNAANQVAHDKDAAAAAATAQTEADYAKHQKELSDRVAAADQRIADLLRQHARAAAGGSQLPAVPGSGTKPAGTAASDERDRRLAAGVSAVGGRCEHDAAEVARWNKWYAEQRAIAEGRH